MKTTWRRAALGYLLAVLLMTWPLTGSGEEAKSPVGAPAPDFSVTDIDGNELNAKGALGKSRVLVLNFWGLRCSACLEEIPHLNRLQEKFGDRVAVIGVNVDGVDSRFLREKMREIGIDIRYRIVPDPDFRMVELFGMNAAPLTVVIDSSGIVRLRHLDYAAGDEIKLEEAVASLLR